MSFLSVPITIFPTNKRLIGEIKVDVIMTEVTNDTLTITKQPVQQGASITDHAFKEPTVLTMDIFFRDNGTRSLKKLYQDLLDLQVGRIPMTITTPKRVYARMLIQSLGNTTDKNTEHTLAINLQFQQVIIVSVSTTIVPRIEQKRPAVTGKTENAGKKSALFIGNEATGGFLGNLLSKIPGFGG